MSTLKPLSLSAFLQGRAAVATQCAVMSKRKRGTEEGASTVGNRGEQGSKLQNLQTFLSWLEKEGARWPKVEFKHSDEWGWHALVKQGETICANEEIISLPNELCINSISVESDVAFGPAAASLKSKTMKSSPDEFDEDTLDRASVCAYIAYQILLPNSRWRPYFDLVPGLEEGFEENVGVWLTNKSKASLLKGTHLGMCVVPEFGRTHDLMFNRFVIPLFSALGKDVSEPTFATVLRRTFRWAAALYFSRAILVPYPSNTSFGFQKSRSSKSYETITPLIDLLNHRPGTLSAMKHNARPNVTGGNILYSNGRTLKSGEQIFLNYGPRSNEDLLAHFGFTLRDNMCDTAIVHLGFPGKNQGPSYKLFRGGGIPEAMLNAVRLQLAPKPTAAAVPASTVYRIPATFVGSSEWLASLSSPTDGEGSKVEVDFDRIGSTISSENEMAILNWIKETCRAQICLATAGGRDDEGDSFCQNVQNYTDGIVAVLNDACAYVDKLMSYLDKPAC